MQDFKKKYSWFETKKINQEDEMMFLNMFYLNEIPIKIKDNIISCPFKYVDIVNEIIKAHYNNNLSQEYYNGFVNKNIVGLKSSNTNINRSWLKVIGPIILVVILLVFFKFLFKYGVL